LLAILCSCSRSLICCWLFAVDSLQFRFRQWADGVRREAHSSQPSHLYLVSFHYSRLSPHLSWHDLDACSPPRVAPMGQGLTSMSLGITMFRPYGTIICDNAKHTALSTQRLSLLYFYRFTIHDYSPIHQGTISMLILRQVLPLWGKV